MDKVFVRDRKTQEIVEVSEVYTDNKTNRLYFKVWQNHQWVCRRAKNFQPVKFTKDEN